jgi:hypothetical protein
MLLLLIGALVFSLFWFLVGRTFLSAVGLRVEPDPDMVEATILAGAFVLASFGQAVHFVWPLKSRESAIVLFGVFLVLAVVRRRDVTWLVGRIGELIGRRPRATLAFVAIAVVIALSAARPCKIEDTENYHAQVLRWTDAASLVPGLALVHGRLAFNSLWFPLEAMLSLAFLSNGPLPLVNTTVFLVGASYLYRQIVAHGSSRLVSSLALAAFLPYLAVGFLYAGSQSPDLPALTFGLLCFFAVARSFESHETVAQALAMCLVGAASCWKLSTAPLLLFVPFLVWDRLVRARARLERSLVLVALFLVVAGAMLIARSVVLSGYPLYPSTAIDIFPVDWKDPSLAHGQEIGIRVFARGLRTPNPTIALAYPLTQWVPIWLRNLNNTARVCLSLLATGLTLFGFSFLRSSTRQWWVEGNRPTLVALALVAVASSAFWFWEAPDVRFGASYLIALAAILYLPWLWPLTRGSTAWRLAASGVIVAAVGLVGENLLLGNPVPPWCSTEYARDHPNRFYWLRPAPYPESALIVERLRDGSINYVVDASGGLTLAHYAPVPNSPLPIAGIAVRRGPRLSEGYRLDSGR